MEMSLTADDVLVGILHELHEKNGTLRLTADRKLLHTAFFKLQPQAPQMMSVFKFRQRDTFYESAELDQAFSNLDATGLISRYNQTPRYYMVDDSLDVCFDSFSKGILERAGITQADLADAACTVLHETEAAAA